MPSTSDAALLSSARASPTLSDAPALAAVNVNAGARAYDDNDDDAKSSSSDEAVHNDDDDDALPQQQQAPVAAAAVRKVSLLIDVESHPLPAIPLPSSQRSTPRSRKRVRHRHKHNRNRRSVSLDSDFHLNPTAREFVPKCVVPPPGFERVKSRAESFEFNSASSQSTFDHLSPRSTASLGGTKPAAFSFDDSPVVNLSDDEVELPPVDLSFLSAEELEG